MRALRVLIAETDSEIRKNTLEHIRAMESVESCEEAAGCAEAVEKCKSLAPDVVVMSSQLPVADALEAVQEMRSSARRRISCYWQRRIPARSMSN